MATWTSRKDGWNFYKLFNFSRYSDSFLEILVVIHVYLLAAWLAIRELIFDLLNQDQKFLQEIRQFPKQSNVALVTGADGTIGREVVQLLLENGYQVIGLVQNAEKEEKQENLQYYEVDFSRLENVREVVKEMKGQKIDVAVFTAGVMLAPNLNPTTEIHNSINLVSQAFLFDLLSDRISRSIFLSSATSRVALYTNPPELNVHIGSYQAYSTSKLYLARYIEQLEQHSKHQIVSMHPGTVPGKLYRHANIVVKCMSKAMLPYLMRSPRRAAILVLATVMRDDFRAGKYYEDTNVVELNVDFDVMTKVREVFI